MPDPVIDVHVHMVAKDAPGCKLSARMLTSLPFTYVVLRNPRYAARLALDFDRTVADLIVGAAKETELVDKVVLLAMDGVYRDGHLDDGRTHFLVSNDLVRGIAAQNPDKVLWGASVNPTRGEAVAVLKECLSAVPPPALMKWIPNSQEFHPYCDVPDEFYECLRENNLPLLCHTGVEHAVHVDRRPIDYQGYGNPRNLCRALDMGVTVIAAHCATKYFPWEQYDGLYELGEMMRLAGTSKPDWELYADVSAMCSLSRAAVIDDVLQQIPEDRMLLGSDHPVPVDNMPSTVLRGASAQEVAELWGMANPIDKNYAQIKAMGLPPEIGTRAAQVLNPAALAA
jgi:hypothetical protein